jgi:Na+/H+ antiporter NhaD/arsenite permease-like protein
MTGLIVFVVTIALIASKQVHWLPIGRPAIALCGATAMVATGVLTPAQALEAIDLNTLALLLGMMLLTAQLADEGTLPWLEASLVARARTPWRYLLLLAWLSAAASAWLVNDTVALFLGASVVRTCAKHRLPFLPFLLALATSANLGSAATLVGNPQNMLIASMSGLSFGAWLARVGPAALVAMCLQTALLWLYFARDLPKALPPTEPAPPPRFGLATVATIGAGVAFLAGGHLGFSALSAAAAVIVGRRRDARAALAQVDFGLLVFFAGLFIVVHGVEHAGWAGWIRQIGLDAHPTLGGLARYGLGIVAGSNLVSNVPLVMLVGPQLGRDPLAWSLLGYVSTVAGNLTLVGSVANLIVAEAAKDHHAIGFWEYARFGIASTAVSLAVGVPLIYWLA